MNVFLDTNVLVDFCAEREPFYEDFEDTVQYFSALQAEADLIVTRDTKGFEEASLPVMTPAEFLARCAE